MAQTGAGLYAGGGFQAAASGIYLREDLIDVVQNLDKNKEAAVFMSIGKTTSNGMIHSWELDTIPATATGGSVEGEDWASAALSARIRLQNAVQNFKFNVGVSLDSLEYSLKGQAPGVGNEYQHQISRHLMALEQSVDARIVAAGTTVASASSTGSGSTALMGTLRSFQVSATAAAGSAESAAVTNCCQINIAGAWSRSRFLALHEFMFNQGANPDTLVVDPGVKGDITNDILGESAATGIRQVHFDNSASEYTQNIQFMRTDYGRVALLVDRFVPTAATATNSLAGGAYFLFEKAAVRLAFWRPIRHYPLPPNGEAARGYVHTGATIEVLSPRALGVGYNITT
jgi:uncharacterized protein DUF5309